MLVWAGVINNTADYTQEDFSKGLQDFIICVEIAIFALCHHTYFS